MCGIAGANHDWLQSRGLDPATAIAAAVQELAWRGPDGQRSVRAGAWWLGCARLAITQPNSHQPVERRGGRFVGVLNGTVTNARELWAQLLPGAERRRAPPNDAWLPLLAIARGAPGVLQQLRGHHAYAVVDTDTGRLWLGRDRFGEKPLQAIVERIGGEPVVVAFASTPAALHRLGGPAPAAGRIAEWFRFGWRHETEPPAVAPNTAPPRPPTAPDLRTAIVDSTARCLDTTVGAALALSGGLDSSCLAAAVRALDRRIPAFRLDADGRAPAERSAAIAAAARAGLELRHVEVGAEVLDALPRLTACAGQPLGDPSILAMHALARAVAEDGHRVLLSGEGADELFFGYRRYAALAQLPRLRWLRAIAPRWSMRYAARWLRAAVAANPAAALLAVTPPGFADQVLAPELTDGAELEPPASLPRAGNDAVQAARAADLRGYLRCDLLPKVDIACMAAGVEARAPFLEGDAWAFGREPSALGKRPLRAAFAAELPPEVLRLRKHGFALPLDRWFRGELPWLDLLAESRTRQRPHLRPGGVATAVDRHRAGRTDLGHGLYLLVAFELFLRWQEQGIHSSVPTEPHPRA
ncbi:MAG: asparagine synthetase B [Planctomycetes bacterium]|jgi:asparagine synthase (glutamine-hydrolysing)|nr:asparagine synthetase B [Planctomycetota bacterium]